MTDSRKMSIRTGRPEKVKPERLGGDFLFRIPYLESRWLNFIFRTLVFSVIALLLMNAAAGKFGAWQETVRLERITAITQALAEADETAQNCAVSGNLTGEQAALLGKCALLHERQALTSAILPEAEELRVQVRLENLSAEIDAVFQNAKADCQAGTDLPGVLNAFGRIKGYTSGAEKADSWAELTAARLRLEIREARACGKTLTAWVQSVRLTDAVNPGKTAQMPLSFAPIAGNWICREDQIALLEAIEGGDISQERSLGEGRAGTEVQTAAEAKVRCLRAVGDSLCGGLAEGFPAEAESTEFTEILCGGIIRVETGGLSDADPAACILIPGEKSGKTKSRVVSAAGTTDETLGKIQVLSENVIVIEEGKWKGTYYRILSDNNTAD